MAVRRRREPPAEPPVDEWTGVPAEVLEAARRRWWREYRRLKVAGVNPAPWLVANPFPGARGRYAHLRDGPLGG